MTPRELLISGSEMLGIPLNSEQVNSLFVYMTELKKWNRKINLTAISDDREVVIKHLLDSLSFLEGFDPGPGVKLLDMGSGAGFPGIPIKIAHPIVSVMLVESVKKKASFLRHIVRTLELTSIEVSDMRIEELPEDLYGCYDVVTARAFADMQSAIAAGKAYLKDGGLLVLSRGPSETICEEDLLKADVSLEERQELTLPHSDYKRAVWVFKKHCSNFERT
jgi:16S rRNA (guanine527-N7)-methyltransferase